MRSNWITEFDPLTGHTTAMLDASRSTAKPLITSRPRLSAMTASGPSWLIQLADFRAKGKLLEAQRLEPRTNFDMEMMWTSAVAPASRIIALTDGPQGGRAAGLLVRIFPRRSWCSAMKPMSACPRSAACTTGLRPQVHAGRIWLPTPSCIDNRPLKFEECVAMTPRRSMCAPRPAPGRWSAPADLHRTGRPARPG